MSTSTTNDTEAELPAWTGECAACEYDQLQAAEHGIVTLYLVEEADKVLFLSQIDTIYEGSELEPWLECRRCLTRYKFPDKEIEYA